LQGLSLPLLQVKRLGLYTAGGAAGWIASVIGAVVLLFIYGMVQKKQG
jgi:uncharacterized membrane protein YeaQ/YmgE (transglycosylase-associated protein family)